MKAVAQANGICEAGTAGTVYVSVVRNARGESNGKMRGAAIHREPHVVAEALLKLKRARVRHIERFSKCQVGGKMRATLWRVAR